MRQKRRTAWTCLATLSDIKRECTGIREILKPQLPHVETSVQIVATPASLFRAEAVQFRRGLSPTTGTISWRYWWLHAFLYAFFFLSDCAHLVEKSSKTWLGGIDMFSSMFVTFLLVRSEPTSWWFLGLTNFYHWNIEASCIWYILQWPISWETNIGLKKNSFFLSRVFPLLLMSYNPREGSEKQRPGSVSADSRWDSLPEPTFFVGYNLQTQAFI